MTLQKTIQFTTESAKIVEQYMQENVVTFNKAVNEIIKNSGKSITLKDIKESMENNFKRIEYGILKINKNILNNNLDK